MKRYWIFIGDVCYPSGGMNDYKDSFDTYEECASFVKGYKASNGSSIWHHVFDSQGSKEQAPKYACFQVD